VASPSTCADECQNTFFPEARQWRTKVGRKCAHTPSGFSKSSNSSLTDFSRGRSRSHSSPSTYKRILKVSIHRPAGLGKGDLSTLAMTIFSERLFDTCFATSMGLVSQLVPLRSAPSAKVIMISCRGCAESCERYIQWGRPAARTLYKGIIFCLQVLEDLHTMVKEIRWWLELMGR
jgi:hypothetical protein